MAAVGGKVTSVSLNGREVRLEGAVMCDGLVAPKVSGLPLVAPPMRDFAGVPLDPSIHEIDCSHMVPYVKPPNFIFCTGHIDALNPKAEGRRWFLVKRTPRISRKHKALLKDHFNLRPGSRTGRDIMIVLDKCYKNGVKPNEKG